MGFEYESVKKRVSFQGGFADKKPQKPTSSPMNYECWIMNDPSALSAQSQNLQCRIYGACHMHYEYGSDEFWGWFYGKSRRSSRQKKPQNQFQRPIVPVPCPSPMGHIRLIRLICPSPIISNIEPREACHMPIEYEAGEFLLMVF
jgi:hypothetical protein